MTMTSTTATTNDDGMQWMIKQGPSADNVAYDHGDVMKMPTPTQTVSQISEHWEYQCAANTRHVTRYDVRFASRDAIRVSVSNTQFAATTTSHVPDVGWGQTSID